MVSHTSLSLRHSLPIFKKGFYRWQRELSVDLVKLNRVR